MRAPDIFSGHRLADLLALGRDTVEIVCPACGGAAQVHRVRDLIERWGNAVLPAVLSLTTASCPRRGKPDQIACGAIYRHPLTVEEEAQIKAWRHG